MADEPESATPETTQWWHWVVPVLAVAALVAIVVVRSSSQSKQPAQTPPDRAGRLVGQQTVQLEIDYGNNVVKRFTALPWREGMTVADALKLASDHRFGIHFTQEGAGGKALLTGIDGLNNEGGSRDARNWIYRINGVLGDRSFASCRLEPFDTVLWTFSKYE